jgi:hypothetical protein
MREGDIRQYASHADPTGVPGGGGSEGQIASHAIASVLRWAGVRKEDGRDFVLLPLGLEMRNARRNKANVLNLV